ncbi:selenoprotein B, glycine/betaine/sarcosine/D-proline reductase domain protein [Acetomicrobium hydrogeniformans ATCC BAA-1850]|jgi:glycine reductase|uniref:Selenoprotein B, glycine/betaine/sarcosine/D-proline reductase domain protein n=3 Tax=Acetomicrobium hydrogeniformans TaxID=649746 RepID=A0A0T5XBK8_9BACT|nr:selenoprotein B, glycine/betaine/sarcosine/D-proline reductase domain protein [Acetomicrobium hydrogeniformans ATCC BAA-1850]
MVKELERAGLPTVHICTIVPISQTVGANRIVPAVAIPHPLGDPTKSPEEERAIRRRLLNKALKALQVDIKEQTLFDD